MGELSIDYAPRKVALAGEPVELTGTEYAVLYQLAAQAPNVLTHGLLLRRVWGPERVGEGWLLRNVVKKLRRKLGDDAADPRYIITEPRVGYRMAAGEGGRTIPVVSGDRSPQRRWWSLRVCRVRVCRPRVPGLLVVLVCRESLGP